LSARRRPTVADLRADKGRGQKTMLRYFSLDEAAAAEAACIDIASVPPELVGHPRYREVAPSVFSMTGKAHVEAGTADDYLRFCGQMLQAGADALYCSGSLRTVEYLTWSRKWRGRYDRPVVLPAISRRCGRRWWRGRTGCRSGWPRWRSSS
jgi:ketopantoate hydroxymethyltransferase